MKATIRDAKALVVVSPMALAAYVQQSGWGKIEPFGEHSDVYAAEGLPEIILPRTQHIGDYADVVFRLIEILADVADMDEISVYRELVTADRDVVRVRADGDYDGSVAVEDGVKLVSGTRDMLLAAACSLQTPRAIYRPGANREASDFLSRVRFGQTEQGSYVVTLLTSVVPPTAKRPLALEFGYDDDPADRQMTMRLTEALAATRSATERTIAGDTDAFGEAVEQGVSANLCEALAQMIEPFPTLDVSLSWARTRPRQIRRHIFNFSQSDAPILTETARFFRSREPKLDERVFGFVQRLKRDEDEIDGRITLRASVDGKTRSVMADLSQSDYTRAIHAHEDRAPVIAEGDLERVGQRWHLRNPSIVEVIVDGDSDDA